MERIPRHLLSLEERLARVEAIQEISEVLARYGPAVDSGSAAATAELWEPEGTYDYGLADGGVEHLSGRVGIERMVTDAGHQEIILGGSAHFLGPPTIQLRGDVAVATGYSMLVRHDAATGRHYVDRVSANRWVLRRTDGVWRVAERCNQLLDGRGEARALLGRAVHSAP